MLVRTVDDALALLVGLGASRRLIRHHELVVETAGELVDGLHKFDDHFDADEARRGAAVHDAGKILYPGEIDGPGREHEKAGRELLHREGHPDLARFCVSHARWKGVDCLTDLLVALSDVLWKGRRCQPLEEEIVCKLASADGVDFFDVYVPVDALFESIACRGDKRLARSIP